VSRIYDAPIDSISLVRGAPASFTFRRQKVVVTEVIDRWVDGGRWWEGEGESDRWRIRSSSGGVYELYRPRTAEGRWMLYKAYD
jgi:hypothetical protein